MRIANYLMAVLFLFGAVVQLNDPDPWIWIAVYLAGAGASLVAAWKPTMIALPLIVGLASLIWALTLAPAVISQVPFLEMFSAWEMKNVGVEQSREMYGLLIIAFWMFTDVWHGRKLNRSKSPEK